MYSKGSVEASIRHYYRGAVHESGYALDVVEDLLGELDLTQSPGQWICVPGISCPMN